MSPNEAKHWRELSAWLSAGSPRQKRNLDDNFLRDNATTYRPNSITDLTNFLDRSEATGYGSV